VKILVVDVGGSNLKLLASGERTPRKLASGPDLTPARAVAAVKRATRDWRYDHVSLGYPGFVVEGRPVAEPANLAPGWVGFDFERAFGCPVRVLNDAAMQALGCYRGGRMLYLGLGTGLGSALVLDGELMPMEIAHLPFRGGRSYEDWLGKRGLARIGLARWRRCVAEVAEELAHVLEIDDLVLGGGNTKKLAKLPRGARRVDNSNAFEGGFRMWRPRARKQRRRA
jgi:predicted NBD/HSP70 family sugar kinase